MLPPPGLELFQFMLQSRILLIQRLELELHLRFLLGYGGKLDLRVLDDVFVPLCRYVIIRFYADSTTDSNTNLLDIFETSEISRQLLIGQCLEMGELILCSYELSMGSPSVILWEQRISLVAREG